MTGISDAIDAARAAVGELMADPELACTITVTADPEGAADDILDEATGRLLPAVGDRVAVYSGPALIASATTRREPAQEGGAGAFPAEAICRITTGTPTIRVGHLVHIDSAPNLAMVGQDYVVDEVPDTAIQVTRGFTIRHTVRGPRR